MPVEISATNVWGDWYDANDKELTANLAERARITDAKKRESIELFRRNVEKGQVLEMQNATHYIFQSNQQGVLDAIEKFVAGLDPLTPRRPP